MFLMGLGVQRVLRVRPRQFLPVDRRHRVRVVLCFRLVRGHQSVPGILAVLSARQVLSDRTDRRLHSHRPLQEHPVLRGFLALLWGLRVPGYRSVQGVLARQTLQRDL